MSLISDAKNLYVVDDRTSIKNYINRDVDYWVKMDTVPTLEQVIEDLFDNDEFICQSYEESKRLANKDWLEMLSVYSIAKNIQNLVSFNMPDDFDESIAKNKVMLRIKETYMNEKISDNDYSKSKKGVAYKVFRIKNGKLYPPMVANAGGADTPIGVWLDAEEGEFAGLSKTGRKQVKSIGSGTLAYRPGWHLGDEPRASQFDRSFSWEFVDSGDVSEQELNSVKTMQTFINRCAKASNIGKSWYVEDIDSVVRVTDDDAPYFPYDFIWAECEYVMDIDYQPEADEQGYMRTKDDGTQYRSDKYQHSLAGLPKLPKNGYYKYRTNPRPDTVPWVITGAMKVTKLLDDFDVKQICPNAPDRQGGNKTLRELGF